MSTREMMAVERVRSDDFDASMGSPSSTQADALAQLLHKRIARLSANALPEVIIGELIGLADDGHTPLILYPGQPVSAALRARSTLDLHGAHIGQAVVLSFENGNPALPIVMGVLRSAGSKALEASAQVQIDADGDRMLITARDQLVLKCGKASITLTKAGKVLIEGAYVSSQSTGLTRIKGGSIQLN